MKTNNRELPFNCRNCQMASKPGVDVNPGSAWRVPAYWLRGVRHRGSVSVDRASMLNCGNLRLRWKEKGTSAKREADSIDEQPRDGAVRSSVEATVTVVKRRRRVIGSNDLANCASRRSEAK